MCDDDPRWKPDHFEYQRWGFAMGIRFLTAKLLDYRDKSDELEGHANPFAAVVLAHLKVLETRDAPLERKEWKLRLVKGLYRRGLSREQIARLFRLIDWMVQLPRELEEQFDDEIYAFEEDRRCHT